MRMWASILTVRAIYTLYSPRDRTRGAQLPTDVIQATPAASVILSPMVTPGYINGYHGSILSPRVGAPRSARSWLLLQRCTTALG